MCSVSIVIEKKIPAPTNRILITAPLKAHQVHLVCLPILRFLLICFQRYNLNLREILGHIGKYTVFKEIPKLH